MIFTSNAAKFSNMNIILLVQLSSLKVSILCFKTEFLLDSPASKFYIILKGNMNVYIPKDFQVLNNEILKQRQRFDQAYKESMISVNNNDVEKVLYTEPILDQNHFLSLIMNEIQLKSQIGNMHFNIFKDFDHFFKSGVFTHQWVSTFMTGTVVGEKALITNKTRSSTIVAREDIYLAVLDKSDFEKIFLQLERYKINKLTDFFSEHFVANISRDTVLKFSYIFTKEHYSTKQIIYKEGDIAQNYYLIKKGEVNVHFKN